MLLVLDVLPVSIPPDLGVDGGNDDTGDSDAVSTSSVHLLPTQLLLWRGQCHPGSPLMLRYLIYTGADWQPARTQSDLLEAQLAPELAALSAVFLNAGALAVELVVLGSGELLGALGAVVAAAGAGGGAAEGHARGLAGSSSGGEHGGWWWSGDCCVEAVLGVACDDGSEVWCERKLELPYCLARLCRLRLPWPQPCDVVTTSSAPARRAARLRHHQCFVRMGRVSCGIVDSTHNGPNHDVECQRHSQSVWL